MGDPRRFHLFADFIADHLPRQARIADVAGGRGILQIALRERGFCHVTSWDRRRRTLYNRYGHRYGWFTHDTPADYDAIVALHPDQATDHAILYAGHRRVPAIISPCCVRPSAAVYSQSAKYALWCAHLDTLARRLHLEVRWHRLPMNGRNDVMLITPA